MLFFYLRHGDPIYNPDMLTALGHRQAKALSKRLATYGLDKIYSSPSIRAQETAQPTCDLLKKEKVICPWADESLAWEDFTVPLQDGRKTWAFASPETVALFHSPSVTALGDEWYKHPELEHFHFENGISRVREAVDNFFLDLGYRHDRENRRFEIMKPNSERVALFAHQGFGMIFFSCLLDIPYPVFCTRFDFGHSSMSVINFEEHGKYAYPKILQLSNDSHLYHEGILTGYHNQINF